LLKKLDASEKKLNSLNAANKETEQLKLIDNRNNIEFYKQELRKRDEHIRDLEALDKADNIELQFYKDEVKLVLTSLFVFILFYNNFYFKLKFLAVD
jgi:hypothetical protein